MKRLWIMLLLLTVLLWAGYSQSSAQVSAQPSTGTVEVVEEHWPDGGLMLRKQVLRQPDGTRVDHGTFERWHKNGQREYEAVFVYGKKEGTTVRYHQNGRKSSQQEYRDGRRHGLSVSWDAAGEKVKEENWADGRPHGSWTIWKDGHVQWRHTYEHGVPDSVVQVDERN